MSDATEVTVQDNPEAGRFEALVAGRGIAGIAEYRRRNAHVVFTHTEVDDAFEGEGIGSALVRRALDRVRAEGLRVKPLCPFVKSWIEKHPEYQDLVAAN